MMVSPSPMPHSGEISIGDRDHTKMADATLKQMGGYCGRSDP